MSCPNYKIVFNDETKYVVQDITEEPVVRVIPARGEQGPQGPQGEQGPQGPQGEQGIQGENGKNFEPTVVSELPETGDSSKLYLTPKAHTTQTATGNPITASVTEQAGALESFKLDGDTFQQTYTGKNLLAYPYYNTTKTVGGITFTDNGDGSVTVNGTLTGNEALFWITRDIWSYNTANIVVPAGTYTISPTGDSHVYLYVSAYGETQGLLGSWNATTTSKTFTISEKASLTIRISVKPQGATVNNLVVKTQLESGSTATTWEKFVGGQPSPSPEYPQQIQTVTGTQTITINGMDYPLDLGNIELNGLGNDGNGNPLYKDYIYPDGDDWKVHKAIRVRQLTGSQEEEWLLGDMQYCTRYNLRGFNDSITSPSESVISPAYCTHFTNVTPAKNWATMIGNSNFSLVQDTKIYRFTLGEAKGTGSLDNFISWLQVNAVILYYVLATPTDTTITDQTLIAQLEAIRTASLENGTNTITNTATGTNLAGDMEISYYEFNPRNRYDKWLWLDINNEYEQLNNPDTASSTLNSGRSLNLTNIQSDSNENNNEEEQENEILDDTEEEER